MTRARSIDLIADAGDRAGLGHVARCTALATGLRAHGVKVQCFGLHLADDIELDGVHWKPCEEPRASAPVAVLDSYEFDAGECAHNGALAVICDGLEDEMGADLVVAQNREELDGTDRIMCGPRHACLRVAFWGAPPRVIREQVQRVLVTTGAMDLASMGAKLAAIARDTLPDAQISMVRGSRSEAVAPSGVTVLDSPSTLVDELLMSDLVLAAAGQTMLEAAAIGTPCIALPLVENQRMGAQQLSRAGAIAAVEPSNVDLVVRELDRLTGDATVRRELAKRAQAMVDGLGALRVSWRLVRMLTATIHQ